MTIWYYVLEEKASGKILATQDVVRFIDCKNDMHTILTVNTEDTMVYVF